MMIWTMPAPCVTGEPCYCSPDDPNVWVVAHEDPNPYLGTDWWTLHPRMTGVVFWTCVTALYTVAGAVLWAIGRWVW